MSYNGKVYVKIIKVMYGLPQSGILENKQLQQSLKKEGYFPFRDSVGLWKHSHRPVWFILVVDDFWVKYIGKEHEENLFDSLRKYYDKVTMDWSGSLYCGIYLYWNYQERWVSLIMPKYIVTLIRKFQYQPS